MPALLQEDHDVQKLWLYFLNAWNSGTAKNQYQQHEEKDVFIGWRENDSSTHCMVERLIAFFK